MPTYHYVCKEEECKHEFDEFQKMSADKLTICPVCNGAIKRVITSSIPPILCGSGWTGQNVSR